MCPVEQHIARACVDGEYHHLYNECKLHLVKMGYQAGIDDDALATGDSPIDQYEYEQLLIAALDKLGVLTSVHCMSVLEKTHLARIMLMRLARIVRYKDLLSYEASVSNAMVLAENQLPYILHFHKRVMKKIMSMIYSISLGEISTTTKTRESAKQERYQIS
jgi:hypothetical protein